MKAIASLVLLALFPATAIATVNIDMVTVGNPGNAPDTRVAFDGTTGYGSVDHDYRIGKTELTNAQYAAFLNAKAASDPLNLYSLSMSNPICCTSFGGITRSGLAGSYTYATIAGRENKPVNDVSWYSAIRFANWLNNGQGSGDTESGAYTLGPLGAFGLPIDGNSITRNPGAKWFLPSENEWYKAAYFNPDTATYFRYPTSSDIPPTAEAPPGGSNSANYSEALNDLTDVGAYTETESPYGAFDMGGNVLEWSEALISIGPASDFLRGERGGWGGSFYVGPEDRLGSDPRSEDHWTGFRVASIPEPSSLLLVGLGAAGALVIGRRFGRVCQLLSVATFAVSLAVPQMARAVTIDTVPVGNVGNANDPATGNLYGGVGYAYRIGKTEVTVGQYTAFLNAVAATDTHSLYNTFMNANLNIAGIARSGESGTYTYSTIGSANMPIAEVSWGDAARFCNWLNNGQPTGGQVTGTTEDGAYTLNGAVTNAALLAVKRNAGAKWFIPTENEWYKAAYHKNNGPTSDYWLYPTGTNSEPNSDQPPGDTSIETNVGNFYRDDGLANGYNDGWTVTGSTFFSGTQNYLTDAGAYTSAPSPYGTFDQGGNLNEWNEAVVDGSYRGFLGGSWYGESIGLQSSGRGSFIPGNVSGSIGFRVATVPEPSTLLLAALACGAIWWRKKQFNA